MSFYFAEKTWEEIEQYVKDDGLIILPVGTIEEHGKHLPVETDSRIATEVAKAIAEEVYKDVPVLVMPTVWSGYSPKAMNKWSGNMRIRPRVFTDMIYDICASLIDMGFKKIIMLDCHGQHAPMLNVATKEIADQFGVYIAVTSPMTFSLEEFNKVRKSERGGVLHACEWETSVMLLYTDNVKMDKVVDCDKMKYSSEFVAGDSAMSGQKVVWSTWGLQKSETGVYGDPTVASKETGQAIMKGIVKNYKKFIYEYINFKK
jgi:creatinine amidohydrolase